MNLAIIPARGGSKRIPRKNIRPFLGKPMIARPIAAALASGLFGHVLVSTDDEEIAAVSRDCGAEVPFLRPASVSDDFSTTADVLRVVLGQWREAAGTLPAQCCCLYGTSVFVRPEQLHEAESLLGEGVEQVMAVTEYAHPVQRALTVSAEGMAAYLQPEYARTRTQDCLKTYYDIGLLYYFSVDAFLKRCESPSAPWRTKAIIVPRTCAMDIDTEEDWRLAEQLAAYNGLN